MRYCLACLVLLSSFLNCQYVQASEVLAVGTEFAYVFEQTPDGKFVGLGADIVRALAKQNGDTVRFEIYPWSRAQWMVENDQAQILIGPYKTPQREAKFGFARRGFYRDYMVFYARKNNALHWDGNYASLTKFKVGAINGWAYGAQFESMRASIKPEIVLTLANGLNMLNAGRVDLLASNMRNTEAMARSMGLSQDFVIVDPVMDTQDGYLAYCKNAMCEQLRQKYDDAFEKLKDSGELLKIARQYNVRTP